MDNLYEAIEMIKDERKKQTQRWGTEEELITRFPTIKDYYRAKLSILMEEIGEWAKELNDGNLTGNFLTELVQFTAVGVAIIEGYIENEYDKIKPEEELYKELERLQKENAELKEWRNDVGCGKGCRCNDGDGEEWCVGTCILLKAGEELERDYNNLKYENEELARLLGEEQAKTIANTQFIPFNTNSVKIWCSSCDVAHEVVDIG